MTDIILETIRSVVLLAIFFYLWRIGRTRAALTRKGWRLLLVGFGLILFGSIIDITDNYASLNQFVLIGDTPAQAVLKTVVGFLGGLFFVALGLVFWLPNQLSVGRTESLVDELSRANRQLAANEVQLLEQAREQKRTEQSVRESEAMFRAIYESTNDAIMLFDKSSFLDCNDATLRVFGCASREEFCGKHPSDFSPPVQPDGSDTMALSNKWIALAMEHGSSSFEWLHKRMDGSLFPAEVLLSLLEIRGKTMLQAVVRDISQRKRAEQDLKDYSIALESTNKTLEELSKAAEAANQSKSEFLANMSHEIRTPMTAILGFTDILLESLKDEDGISAANTIKRNGQYLLELINDILDLSKIEAGKFEIERITCSPCHILNDVVSLMRVRAEAKGLPLDIEYVGAIPENIQCDPTRLRQILINLVGNAIKFTETGSVRLIVRLQKNRDWEDCLRIDLIDSGIGMSQEQVSNLFQPFTQADSSTARKFGGTGLGLIISKRLAEMLGGDISIKSSPDVGSTFCLTVETGPLDGVPMLENVTEAVAENRQKARTLAVPKVKLDCHILLAEDGPDNQRLISFVLKKAGARVTIAENGRVAHDKALAARAAGEPFEIILMDMQMPVMDGYTATRKLREVGYAGTIIALTAGAMVDESDKCRRAGCDDYLTKPINAEKFFSTIVAYASTPAV